MDPPTMGLVNAFPEAADATPTVERQFKPLHLMEVKRSTGLPAPNHRTATSSSAQPSGSMSSESQRDPNANKLADNTTMVKDDEMLKPNTGLKQWKAPSDIDYTALMAPAHLPGRTIKPARQRRHHNYVRQLKKDKAKAAKMEENTLSNNDMEEEIPSEADMGESDYQAPVQEAVVEEEEEDEEAAGAPSWVPGHEFNEPIPEEESDEDESAEDEATKDPRIQRLEKLNKELQDDVARGAGRLATINQLEKKIKDLEKQVEQHRPAEQNLEATKMDVEETSASQATDDVAAQLLNKSKGLEEEVEGLKKEVRDLKDDQWDSLYRISDHEDKIKELEADKEAAVATKNLALQQRDQIKQQYDIDVKAAVDLALQQQRDQIKQQYAADVKDTVDLAIAPEQNQLQQQYNTGVQTAVAKAEAAKDLVIRKLQEEATLDAKKHKSEAEATIAGKDSAIKELQEKSQELMGFEARLRTLFVDLNLPVNSGQPIGETTMNLFRDLYSAIGNASVSTGYDAKNNRIENYINDSAELLQSQNQQIEELKRLLKETRAKLTVHEDQHKKTEDLKPLLEDSPTKLAVAKAKSDMDNAAEEVQGYGDPEAENGSARQPLLEGVEIGAHEESEKPRSPSPELLIPNIFSSLGFSHLDNHLPETRTKHNPSTISAAPESPIESVIMKSRVKRRHNVANLSSARRPTEARFSDPLEVAMTSAVAKSRIQRLGNLANSSSARRPTKARSSDLPEVETVVSSPKSSNPQSTILLKLCPKDTKVELTLIPTTENETLLPNDEQQDIWATHEPFHLWTFIMVLLLYIVPIAGGLIFTYLDPAPYLLSLLPTWYTSVSGNEDDAQLALFLVPVLLACAYLACRKAPDRGT